MSGPIVRKYGFPNFEKIFGERELKHGVEVEPTSPPSSGDEPPKPLRQAEPSKEEGQSRQKP